MDTYFCEIWSYFGPHSWLSVQPRLKRCTFVDFLIIEFWKWILVPIWEISMDSYFYEIWSYFFPHLRLVKSRLKICTFVDFLRIEFWKWIDVLIWEISMKTLFMRIGVVLALVKGWSIQAWTYALMSTISELNFKSGIRYPFER